MSKESYRAKIAPKLNAIVPILMMLLLVLWAALFVPVRKETISIYTSRYSLLGVYVGDGRSYDSDYLVVTIIWLSVWAVLALLIYLCLARAPKQCTLTLTENGISGLKTTLLGSKSVELPFENITSIAVKDGIVDKLVGGKTVAIASATGFIKFLGVRNAKEFTERTLEELRRYKERVKGQQGAVPAPSGDDTDKLAKLKALLDSGVLTQAEYDAKKAEILSRM